MSDDLRRRRDALRAELAAIERELDRTGTPALDPALQEALAGASEFATLIDDSLRVVYNARNQPGAPDVAGRPVLDFIADAYHGHLMEVIERAHRLGHPCPARIDGRGARGATYHLWAVPLPAPVAGATTTLIGFEATHLQQLERALQDGRSAVSSLLEGIPDAVLIVDRERRVTFASHLSRVRREDVMGIDITTLAPESTRDAIREAIDSVFEGGPATAYETHIDLRDGRYWYSTRVGPIVRDDAVVRVCLVATDVTEQHRRELQLQASEARLRGLVDHAPEALGILDADTARFVDASDRACELLGLDRDELTRYGPIDFSPPRQPDGRTSEEAGRAHMETALREGSTQFEWLHHDAEGQERYYEVHLAALPSQERRLLRGSAFDITERKRAERERALLQEELFQAQKMQAIGQLTGGIAHDFNNLLTVIMSHVELLRLGARRQGGMRSHTDEIMAAATRAAALTRQLLAFARRQPLKPRHIDLQELVTAMQRLLGRTLGETIAVKTVCPGSVWKCEADRSQLENALLNLAINARDAMPTGGILTISMENRQVPTTATHADVPPGRYVVITVADTGRGMPEDVMARAFEPFFTTKEVGDGSGMGLAMVYGFAKQSGGHVELDSTPGQGTRVALHLPAAQGAPHETAPPTRGPAQHGNGELILVVEDEPAVRTTTVQALQALGYRTVDAADADTALKTLERTREVTLILTDVVLAGGLSGVQLAQRIAKLCPNTPVAFMSGYAKDAVSRDGQLPQDVQLLQKPFTHDELAAAVRAAIEAPTAVV